jgi:hypothetical protein
MTELPGSSSLLFHESTMNGEPVASAARPTVALANKTAQSREVNWNFQQGFGIFDI